MSGPGAMNGPAGVSVDGLSVHAGGRVLLRDVTFSLRAGDALVVLGESGAGKSLLAQAVMGTLPVGLRAGGDIRVTGAAGAATPEVVDEPDEDEVGIKRNGHNKRRHSSATVSLSFCPSL
jgi:ABC-type glutathione transport system ATPase component